MTGNTVFQNQVMGLYMSDVPRTYLATVPSHDGDLAWYSTPLGNRRQPVHSSLIDSEIGVWLPGVTAGSGSCRAGFMASAWRLGPAGNQAARTCPWLAWAVQCRFGGEAGGRDLPDVGAAVVRRAYCRRCTMTGGAARRGGPRRRGGAV